MILEEIIILAVAFGTISGTVQSSRFKRSVWGYKTGLHPSKWAEKYPGCAGKKQSPIDVKTDKVVVDPKLGKFDLCKLNRIKNVKLSLNNNGHTVEVAVDGKKKLYVRGGGLARSYIVKQFHFHWGSADARGSEHDINGKFFPMEMHIVTYISKSKHFKRAKKAPAGFAVLSFLITVGEENPAFEELTSQLRRVQHKDDTVDIKTFSLSSLLPDDTDVFYRYNGSLTTPPCTENVIWSIFRDHIRISERQLNEFRDLSNKHLGSSSLSNNFRPTQPLNGRTIWTNSKLGLDYSRDGKHRHYHGDEESHKHHNDDDDATGHKHDHNDEKDATQTHHRTGAAEASHTDQHGGGRDGSDSFDDSSNSGDSGDSSGSSDSGDSNSSIDSKGSSASDVDSNGSNTNDDSSSDDSSDGDDDNDDGFGDDNDDGFGDDNDDFDDDHNSLGYDNGDFGEQRK